MELLYKIWCHCDTGVASFISSLKGRFESGSDFARKFGYRYDDVYQDQLLSNQIQREKEVKPTPAPTDGQGSRKILFQLFMRDGQRGYNADPAHHIPVT